MVSVGVKYRTYDRPALATELAEESIQESETAEMSRTWLYRIFVAELIAVAVMCVWLARLPY